MQMIKTLGGKIFLALFFTLFFVLGNANFALAQDVSETPPATTAASSPGEKLFYSATLNQSIFINDKESLGNVRVAVKVLQGALDAVSFEMLGEGEVENVNGEQVKDWSIRKSGARRFIEIRPKENVPGGGEFQATIVARARLELPATTFPLIFTSIDATSWNGIVRIVSIPDLRLYARQTRGLIPVGTVSQNELSFGVTTSPLLRLDVARANELLAPVSLESFSLRGEVCKDSAHFRMRATASVRDLGAEIPVLSGEAALKNFPADSAFSVRTEINPRTKTPTYFLKFPQRGDFDLDLEFDALISDADGWRALNFAVPAVQVAPFSLGGLASGNILFARSSVSVPQFRENAYEGFLPANGEFNLRWRNITGTPPEFSACVFSADTCSEWRVETGILKRREEIQLMISQGVLSNLVFELYGDGDILSVSGADVLAWNVENTAGGGRELHVALSQKKRGAYSLRVESQTAFAKLPSAFRPLRVVPVAEQPDSAACVRFNEFLRLRNDGFVRFDIAPRPGITQVATSAFPHRGDFFEKNVPAENLFVYRLASGLREIDVSADAIRPDLSVKQATRCYFDDEKILAVSVLELAVRAAPLYELTVLVPEDFSVTAADSEKTASYEVGELYGDGFREVKVVFSEPILGEHELVLSLKKDGISVGEKYEIRGSRFPQARFVSGFIGLGGSQKVRLIPHGMNGLTEVPAEFYPVKRGSTPQQVFRMRDAAWNVAMRVERMLTELHGDVSCVYAISPEKIFGRARIAYDSGNELTGEVKFALPAGAKLVSATGECVAETHEKDGVCAVVLRTPQRGKFALDAAFELPGAARNSLANADFSGVRLEDVSGENGEIFITSAEAVALGSASAEANNDSAQTAGKTPAMPRLLKLARSSVSGADFAERGAGILLGAYQYVSRPFDLKLDFVILPEKTFPPAVITRAVAEYSARASETAPALVCNYDFLASAGAGELRFRVPEGLTLLACAGVKENSDGTFSAEISEGEGSLRLAFDGDFAEKKFPVALPVFDAPVLSVDVLAPGEFFGTAFKNGRNLNEDFAEFFLRVKKVFGDCGSDFAIVLVAAAGVFAGTLLILLTSRLGVFARAILGISCTIAAGALVAGGNFVIFRALVPAFAPSVASFGIGENFADVSLALWSPLFHFERGTGEALLAAGIFLLAFGSVCVRSRIARLLGRAVFYGAAILLVQDATHSVPALVACVLATEIFMLLVNSCFALKGVFSRANAEKKTASGAGAILPAIAFFLACAGTFFASAETRAAGTGAESFLDENLEQLAVQTEPRGNDAEDFSRPQNIAERISQVMKILPDRVVAAGEIRVKGRSGERFDLLAAPAVLTSFQKSAPDAAIRLERRRANGGIVYQVVLERAGTFSANFSYELALAPDSRGVSLLTGNASADVVTLIIMREDIRLGSSGAVTLDVSGESEDAQLAQIVFKPVAERKIFWNPRERAREDEPLVLFSESSNLYVPAGGVIEGYHALRLTPSQGEFDSVSVKIPEPFSVSRVEGGSIRRWNFGRDKTLKILFDSKKSEPLEISIYTQAALDLSAPQVFSPLQALECRESVRTIGVATGDDLQIDEISAPEMVSVDEKEFPKKLIGRAVANEPSAQLRRAFREVAGASACRVSLSEVKPNLRISSVDKIVLNRDKISFSAELTAQVSRADVFNLAFTLPDGLEVESISGDALGYWAESREGVARKVTLYLKKQFSGEEKFSVALAGAFPLGAQSWSVPRIVFDEAKQQYGEAFIFTEEGLRLSLRSRENAVETQPGENENAELQKADFAMRYFGRRWNVLFSIGSSLARAEADWTQEIFPRGRYALVEAGIVYRIENATCRLVRVRLPQNALAPRFSGDQVVSASALENASAADANVYEVRLAKPMRGEIPFAVRYFVPFEEETKIGSLAVLDVAREHGSARVHCGKILDMENGRGGNAEFSEEGNAVGGERGVWATADFSGKTLVAKAFPRALEDWQSAKTGVSDDSFSGVSTNRVSVISPAGARTEETISLRAAHTELLRIEPGKAKLLSVKNGGVPAKVFSDNSGALYVPVDKNPDGAESKISLLYQSDFGGEFKEIIPAETSARPTKMRWEFRANSGNAPAEVLSVFGQRAREAGRATGAGDAKSAFVSEESKFAFAPAMVVCEPAKIPEQKSDGKYFLATLAGFVVLRLLAMRFLRKRSRK